MPLHVIRQVTPDTKSLLTQSTSVWLLAGVRPCVHIASLLASKSFFTELTDVRLDAGVRCHVPVQVGLTAKSVVTHVTCERLLYGVAGANVRLQSTVAEEGLAAVTALVACGLDR